MTTRRPPLRIAMVQFKPKLGDVAGNTRKALELCSTIQPRSVDLLCFPEMILTGYMFDSAKSIYPYLESPKTGPTSQLCTSLAKRLECYVIAGYPEKLSISEAREAPQVGANSALLIGPSGEWIGGYRKSNLFVTDKSWAKPGPGFAYFDLPAPLYRIALGICMDLNVAEGSQWTSLEHGPYELASFALEKRANILVIPCAWLASDREHRDDLSYDEDSIDTRNVSYWCERLRPLWAPDGRTVNAEQDTAVIICNRAGQEIVFAGSSTMLKLSRSRGRPLIIGGMTREEEAVKAWTLY
ncbi:carbon-nitrogen hydrolase [Sistotremastrum suecicum HHB10207 ss-3]|uniref:Carbon-nitrogen hydrolase n=1 Tax=Sistotremastrum suecicum HHB10207 ss-3 TaxID=1314776 RepID=A0A166DUP6_9AGAM|nr:carbon-nitrogen hydrolase [Sistotremastrum suecicum HHB10207 ss-3]